ncbi:MAG: glycosyltransferase family 2 protein [Acidimicrobiia bacterium]|nr:glycosyltransferase family 2 protein [Acidimicrobiia bacterium]
MPPTVSIILPVFNEAGSLDSCLASLQAQDYSGTIEIVVADGGSTDGTRRMLEDRHSRGDLVMIDNPQRRQWAGLNLAAGSATGEILVRVDGHSTYAVDYVRRSVDALHSTEATAVGGRMIPASDTPVGSAIVSAMASPWAVGPARYRHQDHASFVDTVYLGAFRKSDFERLGGYRDLPGVAEDADLYYRWRTQGARILLDPSIGSTYEPRNSWSALARQYFRYGWGKADMLYANRVLPSLRPLAPLALVLGLAAGAAVAVTTSRQWPFFALLGLWFAALLWVAVGAGGSLIHRLRTLLATALMQLAFGIGLLGGMLRGPGPRRHLQS